MSSDFWAKLTAQPRPVKVIDFPRVVFGVPKQKLALRIVTQQEQLAAVQRAGMSARKLLRESSPGDIDFNELYARRLASEVLALACREVSAENDPDSVDRPFFPTGDVLEQVLNVEEIGVLLKHYRVAVAELGPEAVRKANTEETAA